MRNSNGYLIFFVIVAVGLVLSWGQVGRRTNDVLRDRQVEFLQVDADCAPSRAPCGALGGRKAIVLGPASGGNLLLKAVGIEPGSGDLEVTWLDKGREVGDGGSRRRSQDAWEVGPIPAAGAEIARIGLVLDGTVYMADFPLR